MDIFVSRDGKCSGPYSPLEIEGRLSDGRLKLSDEAWYEGLTEWTLLSRIDAVSSLMAISKPKTMGFKQVDVEIVSEPAPIKTVLCPWCVEPIVKGSPKCKHCGEVLSSRVCTLLGVHRALQTNALCNEYSPQNDTMHNPINNGDPRRKFPHAIHLVITLLSVGTWIPIWLAHYSLRDRAYYH